MVDDHEQDLETFENWNYLDGCKRSMMAVAYVVIVKSGSRVRV